MSSDALRLAKLEMRRRLGPNASPYFLGAIHSGWRWAHADQVRGTLISLSFLLP
jgi:hypothetical protein